MSGGEWAAMITAIGTSIAAILAALAALRNARYSKERVVILQEQIDVLKQAISDKSHEVDLLKEHNIDQDAVLIGRDNQIAELRAENEELRNKISKWHEWGIEMGRVLNQLQLEVGFLHRHSMGETAPLPPNEDEPLREE